ncbi:MAG TPA: MlaD family protein [Acidimicrobiales bacterium]|nr:MlaD family protein [Acidimicrobiales bacterium]
MKRRALIPVVVCAALLASMLSACATNSTTVTVVFDDSGDLQPRGSVQTADVRIGRIGSIHLTKDFKARVTLHINPGHHIPQNVTAVLRTTSLLGEKFVELRPRGNPTQGPFLKDGDVIKDVQQAPELEFVAEQAVDVLGQVTAGDVATLIDTGATSVLGRKDDIRTLIDSLSTFSTALATRTQNIGAIVDHLDTSIAAVAGEGASLSALLSDLATTTKSLADNRDKAVAILRNLSRLAAVQNTELDKYQANVETQIHQADDILRVLAGQSSELQSLIDWLDKFVYGLPSAIPNDFTNVIGWLIPYLQDPRAKKP